MNPALRFLVRRSFVNGLKRKISRLRNPRYLIPTLAAIAYFALVFGGQFFFRSGRNLPVSDFAARPETARLLEWLVTSLLLLQVASTWLLPSTKPGIIFTEPEVEFLFGAPLTRRELVTFKILSTQPAMVISTMVFGFFAGINAGPFRAIIVAVSMWFLFNIVNLHQMGARFLQSSLYRHGTSGLRRAAPALAVLTAFVAIIAFTAPPLPPLDEDLARSFPAWIDALGESHAGTVLLPFRAVARLALSPDPLTLMGRLPLAALILVALYTWVVRCDSAFEDAAATQAKDIARVVQAVREGRLTNLRQKPRETARAAPWRLRSTGGPEGAFFWKSVTELSRSFSPHFLALIPVLVAGLAYLDHYLAGRTGKPVPVASGVLFGLLVMLNAFVLMGQGLPGGGFRGALRSADLLKTLPVNAARLVRCIVLANFLPLAILQVLVAFLAVALCPDLPRTEFTLAWRISVAASAALVLPSLLALALALDAAFSVQFPGWLRPGEGGQAAGFEMMGQNLVLMLGKGLGGGLAVIAPGLVGGGTAALLFAVAPHALRPAAVLIGAALASAVMFLQLHLATKWMGSRFEQLDPAEEELLR